MLVATPPSQISMQPWYHSIKTMQRLLITLSAAAIGCSLPILPWFQAVSIVSEDGTSIRVDTTLPPGYMPTKASPIIAEHPNLQHHDNDDGMSVDFSTESTTVIIANTGGKLRLVSDGQERASLIHTACDGTRQLRRLISLHKNWLLLFVLGAAIGAAGTIYFVLRYGL